MMHAFYPLPVLTMLSFAAVAVVGARAAAEEFKCERGDLVRRIEVQFADDADRLPCEVIYWRDDEAPGQPQTLWNAEHELEFCENKAREMADRLEDAGWACERVEVAAAATAPERAAPRRNNPEQPSPSRDGRAAAGTAQPEATARPAGAARPDEATLRAALARDIQRLEQLTAETPGNFAAQATALGDLNSDGLADAAVLLTHRADGAAPEHYLLAYLFTGDTFRPVARLSLGAYYKNVTEVGIREVAGGAVEIEMQLLRAGDPSCCPSGRREATFGLRDRELVLLNESDSGA